MNQDLYDRQNRTYGIDTLNQINKSYILLIENNSNKLETEIYKNLILSGINILNYNNNYKQNQNITILINSNNEFIKEINIYTRSINSKLICIFTYGFGGDIFIDAGNIHYINDILSESIDDVVINNIDRNGIITCYTPHNFQSEFIITFKNLEGENLEELKKEWSIIIINKLSFQLKNFNITNYNFVNGYAVYIKKPIIINNNPFINYNKKYDYNFELMPVISILGSLVVSEVIKLITNKYMPINQWFNWEEIDLKPIEENNNSITLYGKLYGTEFETNLLNSKWFIVGAGAIGCEHLKNLEYFNNIIITDPDIIENSNLNRQFLFKNNNIGKFKSIIAAHKIKEIYSNIEIQSLILKVGEDNINFEEMNLTGILSAVDNIEARKFIDNICVNLGIPMFDSGTEGLKGSVQPIIPYITETYSNSKDPETITYPICTIKSFPNNNIHTIFWAMDILESLNINSLPIIELFNELYYNNIIKILEDHPKDEIINSIKFWSGGRKCPNPIHFDNTNNLHLDFINLTNQLLEYKNFKFDKENNLCISWITTASNLRAINYNIPLTDFYTTKGIAGKIIPAVPTTTSLVSGLAIIEVLKFLMKKTKYKSSFINLSIPIIINSEPLEPHNIIINNNKFNIWNKLNYTKNSLLSEFKKYYENIFNININIILFDDIPIYIQDLDENFLNKKINEINNNKIIKVNIYSDDTDLSIILIKIIL